MEDLIRIPCVLMRGGTSKGPYFVASDLPDMVEERDRVLISAMGSGNPLEIDGIGGRSSSNEQSCNCEPVAPSGR